MPIPKYVLLMLLSGLMPTAQAGIEGRWQTDFGPLDLRQSDAGITGNYGEDDGRLRGRLSGAVLSGYWTEAYSDQPCPTPGPDRNRHWGRIEFRFDGDRFHGR